MPECRDCNRQGPTSEFRRSTRAGVAGFICKDTGGCKHRVAYRRREERLSHLTRREAALLDRSFSALDKLKTSLGPSWETAPATPLRNAHVALQQFIHPTKEESNGN